LGDRAAISTASLRFTPASISIAISFKRRIWSSRFARFLRIRRRRLASAAIANDKGTKPRRFSSRSAARSCSATTSPLTLFPTLVSALYMKVGIADCAPPPRQAVKELGRALTQHFNLAFHFAGDLCRFGAAAAQTTCQPLRHDKPNGGCNEKRLDTHIDKPGESAQRVVGVQSREH